MRRLLFLFAFLPLFLSCSKEDAISPLEREECTLGYTEVLPATVEINIYLPVTDTIYFTYLNEDNIQVVGQWIEGVIEWECLGFARRNEAFKVTIWDGTTTCHFTIPPLDQ